MEVSFVRIKPDWLMLRILGVVALLPVSVCYGFIMAKDRTGSLSVEFMGLVVMSVPFVFLLFLGFACGAGSVVRRLGPTQTELSWKQSPFTSRDFSGQQLWVGASSAVCGVGLGIGVAVSGTYFMIEGAMFMLTAGLSMCVAGLLRAPKPSQKPLSTGAYGMRSRVPMWLLKFSLVVSICAIVGSEVWFVMRLRRLSSGVVSDATVTRVVEDPGGRSRYVVRFRERGSDKDVKIQTTWSADPPAYRVGDRVEVIHPRGGSQDVVIATFWGLWGAPSIILVIAIVQALGCTGALCYLSRGDARGTGTGNGGGEDKRGIAPGNLGKADADELSH